MRKIPLTNGGVTLVDDEDHAFLSAIKWLGVSYRHNRYVRTTTDPGRFMHNVIMGEKSEHIVDHRNWNGLDNRRKNLRWANFSQNSANRRIAKNNISGTPGVYWSNRDKRWTAGIQWNGVHYYLGTSKSKKVAIRYRKDGEKKFFGDFAPNRRFDDAAAGMQP